MGMAMNTAEQQLATLAPEIFDDAPRTPTRTQTTTTGAIPEGQRNSTYTRMAGAMRHHGFVEDAIAEALIRHNGVTNTGMADAELRNIARSVGRYAPSVKTPPALVALTLDQLTTHTFPDRKPLLVRGDTVVFREGHLGEAYAERGFGKTWFLKTLALIAATGGEALGFRAPNPCRVLDIDGEMASPEIQERYAALGERLGLPATPNLTIVAADWQEQFLPRLDTPEGQAAVEPFVENADLVFLDNRSCLFDPESEKDPAAWQSAQDWLLSLRRRGKAVMLAHHSNRQGGARGHSKPEDPMNLLMNC
jgi:hypothetical protein